MNKVLLLLLLISNIFFCGCDMKRYDKGMQSVAILPFEDVQMEDIELIRTSIEQFYGYDVTILPVKENPSEAYHLEDESYDVKKVLSYIFDKKNDAEKTTTFNQIIGVINAPIKELNRNQEVIYPMIAKTNDRVNISVISTYSIKNASFTLNQNRERLKKIALHEIGRLLGLGHCHTHQKCLMRNFDKDIAILDSSEIKLCRKCTDKIGWN